MKIGIDIDNVISNFNDTLLTEYLLHDKELRNSGIINKNADYIRKGMFDWNENEETNFYKNNIERIAKKLGVIEGAKEYIDKLHDDGHIICIITGRDNGEYTEPYNMTKKWLEDNNIYYDDLILTDAYDKHAKTKQCLEHNIDIMIDDSVSICSDCVENGITTILMDTPYNRYSNIQRVKSWKEFYRYVLNYKKDKINLILDTDTYNECDDQFALSYLIKSKNIFNIEAITVAPYSHTKRDLTVRDGQELSYNEILKICNWLNFDTNNKVFKGSMDYIQNGYDEKNNAVNKIIEIALKNNKTYILGIGAITNIALAIKKEPKIVNKIEIVWLGGNELGYKDNLEYNFRQDVEAVKIVFESKVKLTILPCKEIVSELRIDINTLKKYLENKSELCNYLIERFYNDGYHGVQESRVIWDISVIAYMINKKWFETEQISCPNIRKDTSYEVTDNRHNITFVTKLDRNKIYEDLFNKLGEQR
jgi:inosine-uridine nucleoside N-ribohydrolase